MRPTQIKILLALAAAFGFSTAHAAKWESVATVKGEHIEIDKSRIAHARDGKATAWSRLALDRDFIDEYGMRYTAIEALNRYDCEKHSFSTVKRVYRRDGQVVREETVGNKYELAAEPGSADGMLLAEACKTRPAGEAQKTAEAAPKQAVEARAGKPTVMYADVRSAESGAKKKIQQVADKPMDSKPAEAKPADKAADKPADGKSGERPHYIDLPKIDKSQIEDPGKDSAAKPPEGKAAAKPSSGPAAAAKAASAAAERTTEMSTASRRELERLYATSGPRKAVKKKPAPAPADTAATQHRDIQWSYEGEGAPANWGKLRGDYAACATGQRQSPIDIHDGIKVDLEPIKFDYKPAQFRITDDGHTIMVDVGEGSSIRVMERQFQLLQFHFHRPAEERVNGKSFDMVVHLVHKDDDGKLAVVAVLLQKGNEHPLIQALWNNIPLERGQSVSPATVIDLNQLLPQENRAYYTYMGSLTTPPCTEDVLWMVMKQPVQVSPQQVSIFSRLYPNNARPVQPSNGRLVKETR